MNWGFIRWLVTTNKPLDSSISCLNFLYCYSRNYICNVKKRNALKLTDFQKSWTVYKPYITHSSTNFWKWKECKNPPQKYLLEIFYFSGPDCVLSVITNYQVAACLVFYIYIIIYIAPNRHISCGF